MNFPGERMQPVNRKVFYRKLVCVAFILSMFFPMQASAFRTPFGDEVYRAVERGLAWVRTQLDGGAYNGVTTPLGGLVILERRSSRHWNAPTRGYVNSSRADKGRLREISRYIINNDLALTEGEGAHSYHTGIALAYLALYRSTGGPNDVDASCPSTRRSRMAQPPSVRFKVGMNKMNVVPAAGTIPNPWRTEMYRPLTSCPWACPHRLLESLMRGIPWQTRSLLWRWPRMTMVAIRTEHVTNSLDHGHDFSRHQHLADSEPAGFAPAGAASNGLAARHHVHDTLVAGNHPQSYYLRSGLRQRPLN